MAINNKYNTKERRIIDHLRIKIRQLTQKQNNHRKKYLDLDVKIGNLKYKLQEMQDICSGVKKSTKNNVWDNIETSGLKGMEETEYGKRK